MITNTVICGFCPGMAYIQEEKKPRLGISNSIANEFDTMSRRARISRREEFSGTRWLAENGIGMNSHD